MEANIIAGQQIPDNSMPEWNRIVLRSLAKDDIVAADAVNVKKRLVVGYVSE